MSREVLLSKGRIFSYGMAEWGSNGIETFFRINLLIYCTDILAIAPGVAGLIVAIGVVWDGITDPLVGSLSDRLRSPYGRRIPLILLGTISLPLIVVMLFSIGSDETLLPWKFGLVYLLSNTALTLISVPHAALAGDLSSQAEVRNQIFAVRYFYTIAGLLTGIALPGYLLQAYGNQYSTYQMASWGIGGLICLSGFATIFSVYKLDKDGSKNHRPTTITVFASYRKVFSQVGFLILVGAYLLATIGQSINSSLALYYYRYRLKFAEQDLQLVLVVFTIVISFSLPLWYKFVSRFDKIKLLSVATILLGGLGAVVYPLVPEKSLAPIYLMSVVGGVLVGSVFLLEVILADFVDQQSSGSPKEAHSYGIYFGLWKLSAKVARAVAIGLSGLLLEVVGFSSQAMEQTKETIFSLGILFGPVVGFFFVGGGVLILLLPRYFEHRKA